MQKLSALAAIFFCIIIIMAAGNGCAVDEKTAADSNIEGIWLGVLSVPSGPELRVAFDIKKAADGKISATLSSIDQGAMGIPVNEASFENGALHLKVNSIGGVYEGKYDSKGPKITGTWTQGGGSLPLLLERVEKIPE
jgi:uncharacterized protein